MPWVGFEPTIPLCEWAKTVHVLDRPATVIGYPLSDMVDKTWDGQKRTQILLLCIHLMQVRTYEKKPLVGLKINIHSNPQAVSSTVHVGNNTTSDTAGTQREPAITRLTQSITCSPHIYNKLLEALWLGEYLIWSQWNCLQNSENPVDSKGFWWWRITELLGIWTFSNVRCCRKQKTRRFGNWICFRPQVAVSSF
jgi:hypothetical protein